MQDWVLSSTGGPAKITITQAEIILENGLVRRAIQTQGCKTASFCNLQTNTELLDAPRPDWWVQVDATRYGADGFRYMGAQAAPCLERVPFLRTPTMTAPYPYPPAGKAVLLHYQAEGPALAVTVRYEIYDGMPVIMKQLVVANTGQAPVNIANIGTDVLQITQNRDTLFVDSDYNSTTDFLGLDLAVYAKNYARYCYDFLEVAPQYRMHVRLQPGDTHPSITAFELLFMTAYYEQRLIEVKTFYRRTAPWCTDTVLFFHLIADSSAAIRKAVDACAEIGLEMIIQSFGSGVKMESENEAYLQRIRQAYAYGHAKNIRMGAYTLAYVKNYRPVRGDEALNHDGSHICRCLACEWANGYMQRVLNFIDKTGADAVEIDGPYGMLLCAGGKTHLHNDFTDSQYKQWRAAVVQWYAALKSRGVYINAPDWHFLNGSNRTGVGYEEIAFSEPREEQLLSSRIYYYKGTFSKNPSQGWGFVPLDEYHGGGKAATFFPTEQNSHAFDWALAQVTASGVWPTLRGKRVYDSEAGKKILQKWVGIYKKYRKVLNGITVHFMPPRIDPQNPARTTGIDAIMNQLPEGDTRGFVMFFNQSDTPRTEEVLVPVYYTGLSGLVQPPAPFAQTKNSDVSYRLYGDEIAPLEIRARDKSQYTFMKDAPVADKPIAPLPQGEPTQHKLTVSLADEAPQIYTVDSNGNIRLTVELPAMSYKWYTIRAAACGETNN